MTVGWDPGMPGKNGEDEQFLNLKIANKLREYLELSGSFVIVTRDDNNALSDSKRGDLNARKNIVNNSDADIIVSIHQNSFPNASIKGAQVFYHKSSDNGKLLADCIQKELVDFADKSNKRVAKANTDYYILKNTNIPAVIVECGFLTNYNEEQALNTDEYRDKIAWSIYKGINEYFLDISDVQ